MVTKRKSRRVRKSRKHRGGSSVQNEFIQTNYEVVTLEDITKMSTNEIPKHLRYKIVRMSRGNKLYSGYIIKQSNSYCLDLVNNYAVQDNEPFLGIYRDIKKRFFPMNKLLLLDANDIIYLQKTPKSTEENNKLVKQLENIVKKNRNSEVKKVYLSRKEQNIYEPRGVQPVDNPQNLYGYNRYREMGITHLQGQPVAIVQPPGSPADQPVHSQENGDPVVQYENSRAKNAPTSQAP